VRTYTCQRRVLQPLKHQNFSRRLKCSISPNPANSVFHWHVWRLQGTQLLMWFRGIYHLLDQIYSLHLIFAQVMLICSFSGINHFLQQVNLHSFCLFSRRTLCSQDPISKNRFLSFCCRGFGMYWSWQRYVLKVKRMTSTRT
jgi:hypothetical protein